MDKKLYGLFVSCSVTESELHTFMGSSHLVCASSNLDKLLEYQRILQAAADLLFKLQPSRNCCSTYKVDEINFLDLL